MFWHEKVDQLKKRVPSADFRDPYKDGVGILKKIHDKFLTPGKPDYNQVLVNWTYRAVLPATLAEVADRFVQVASSTFRSFFAFSPLQQGITCCRCGDHFR